MTGSLKDDVECDNWFLIQLHFEQSTELLTNAIHAHCDTAQLSWGLRSG